MLTSRPPIPDAGRAPCRPTPPSVPRRPGRRTARLAAICVAVALAGAACHGGTPTPTPNLIGPKAVRIHGPIHTSGTTIVDASGGTVRFNGVGVREYVTVGSPGASCVGTPSAHEERDIVDWGFNSVRIPLAWANLEPTAPTAASDGTLTHAWNGAYLSNLDGFVHAMTSHGLAVFFTLHNKFGSNTDKGSCNLSSIPGWMYPSGIGDPAQAKCDFLNGTTQPGAPEAIWDGYQAVWTMLSARYASNPQVVAADLVNEPYPAAPCGPNDTKLGALYEQVGKAVRQENPNLALILEDAPPRLAESGKFELDGPTSLANVIYSYHLYQDNWDPDGKAVNDAYWTRAQAWNIPLLVGEFNAFGYAAPGGGYDKAWATDTVAALTFWKQNGISWMAWAYSGGNHLVNHDGSPRADLVSTFQKGF